MIPQSIDNTAFDAPDPLGPDPWAMRVVRRAGAPPLRFKGRQLFHCGLGALFVTLWRRKKGDFVLSYSALYDHAVQPDACVVDGIAAASAHLEKICPDPCSQKPMIKVARFDIDDYLLVLHYQHQFPILVGNILAAWDAHITPAPSN